MKQIKILPEEIEKILREIRSELARPAFNRSVSVKFSNKPKEKPAEEKAVVYITELARLKMDALVDKFDTEIGWYGVTERLQGDGNAFLVSDVLVYPQTVTGANIESDPVKEAEWFQSLDADILRKIRFQGHSHVRMGTSPSSTDCALYDRLLSMTDDFYIFMITNKRGEHTVFVCDIENNVMYENADVEVKIYPEETLGVLELIRDAKQKVRSSQPEVKSIGNEAKPAVNYGKTQKKSGKKQEAVGRFFSTAGRFDDDDDDFGAVDRAAHEAYEYYGWGGKNTWI